MLDPLQEGGPVTADAVTVLEQLVVQSQHMLGDRIKSLPPLPQAVQGLGKSLTCFASSRSSFVRCKPLSSVSSQSSAHTRITDNSHMPHALCIIESSMSSKAVLVTHSLSHLLIHPLTHRSPTRSPTQPRHTSQKPQIASSIPSSHHSCFLCTSERCHLRGARQPHHRGVHHATSTSPVSTCPCLEITCRQHH